MSGVCGRAAELRNTVYGGRRRVPGVVRRGAPSVSEPTLSVNRGERQGRKRLGWPVRLCSGFPILVRHGYLSRNTPLFSQLPTDQREFAIGCLLPSPTLEQSGRANCRRSVLGRAFPVVGGDCLLLPTRSRIDRGLQTAAVGTQPFSTLRRRTSLPD